MSRERFGNCDGDLTATLVLPGGREVTGKITGWRWFHEGKEVGPDGLSFTFQSPGRVPQSNDDGDGDCG